MSAKLQSKHELCTDKFLKLGWGHRPEPRHFEPRPDSEPSEINAMSMSFSEPRARLNFGINKHQLRTFMSMSTYSRIEKTKKKEVRNDLASVWPEGKQISNQQWIFTLRYRQIPRKNSSNPIMEFMISVQVLLKQKTTK